MLPCQFKVIRGVSLAVHGLARDPLGAVVAEKTDDPCGRRSTPTPKFWLRIVSTSLDKCGAPFHIFISASGLVCLHFGCPEKRGPFSTPT
jgi:hypothetical protein